LQRARATGSQRETTGAPRTEEEEEEKEKKTDDLQKEDYTGPQLYNL